MPDNDDNDISVSVQALINKLDAVSNPRIKMEIIYDEFDYLSDKGKSDFLTRVFLNDLPKFDSFGKLSCQFMYDLDGGDSEFSSYTMIRMLVESANLDLLDKQYTPFVNDMEHRLSLMSDEDFQSPTKVGLLVLETYYDNKGKGSELKTDINNSFRSKRNEEEKLKRKKDGTSRAASMREYVNSRGKKPKF